MKLSVIAATAAFASLSFNGIALADDVTAPPAGITPTTMTLQRLLSLHEAAVGMVASGTAHTRVEEDTYKQGPLSGTQHYVRSGDNYREDDTFGPFHSAEGSLNGRAWEQNKNSLLRTISGIHQRTDVDMSALAHPAAASSNVRLLGTVSDPNAYVVAVRPANGRPEFLFYDKTNSLIVRKEEAVDGRRVVTTYDDFRTTSGVREAWHVHRSNGLPNDDEDWQTQSLQIGAAVDPSQLTIPEGKPLFAVTSTGVRLPARISADRVILTARLGGHKVNFQLDSGASEILLDRSVADATNVQSFGTKTEITAGQYAASDALVPQLQLGGITLRNLAVETAPFSEWSADDEPVAGLMGYDFIASCVLHIDYLNGTAEILDPEHFTAPAGGIELPVRLDDGVPVVSVKVNQATGDHFIIDTGADRSMIFSAFAQSHAADVIDQGLGEEMTYSLPLVDKMSGVGGKITVRPVQVPSLTIGSITFPKWLFSVSQDAPAFEGEDYDGLIGQDVLRNFDVYLDYPQQRIYIVPNDRYRQRWGK